MKKQLGTLAILATMVVPGVADEPQSTATKRSEAASKATAEELPKGILRFNGMLVGRLVTKDIERGTFVVKVDAVSRVWRNSQAENPRSIEGKTVEVGGVFDKWLDTLVVTRTGETIEFECKHDGDGLKFPGELLRKVAPYKAEDYPRLPEAFRGFHGSVVADILKKDPESFEMMVKVSQVRDVWRNNKAKDPKSIEGRSMLLAGFWNRKETYHQLKPGSRIEVGMQHISRQSDHLSVAEFVRKAGSGDSKMERMKREEPAAKGSASSGFRGMLVGRLVEKDIERGTFTVAVDAVPRVWNNNRSRNPKAMIGTKVSASGVTGKMLDALIVARTGETIEFGALHDGEDQLRVGEVLRKVAPVEPGDYPELPDAARGIKGMMTAKVVEKDDHLWSLIVQVTSVGETFDGSRAENPKSLVGKRVMLAGFWNRKEAYQNLRVGDVIRCGVNHPQKLSDNLSVIETLKKIEKR